MREGLVLSISLVGRMICLLSRRLLLDIIFLCCCAKLWLFVLHYEYEKITLPTMPKLKLVCISRFWNVSLTSTTVLPPLVCHTVLTYLHIWKETNREPIIRCDVAVSCQNYLWSTNHEVLFHRGNYLLKSSICLAFMHSNPRLNLGLLVIALNLSSPK
jgi:hypothetical protein